MFELVISPWAVLVASFAAYLFGWLWYSPILWQKPWMESTGVSNQDYEQNGKKEMPRVMLYGFLVTVVIAYGIAVFLALLQPESLIIAIQLAMLICFSFIVTANYMKLIYESKDPHWSRKPQMLFLISSGHQIGQFLIMTAVIWYMTGGNF